MAENGVAVAFDMVLEEIQAAIEALAKKVAAAGSAGDFRAASELAAKGKQVAAFRDKVLALKNEWEQAPASASAPRRRSRRKKLGRASRSGLKTPQEAFEKPVLRAVHELGGAARVAQVLDRVGQIMGPLLTEHDRGSVPSSPRTVRWRNAAQWARLKLVQRGLLAADSPTGVWQLTEAGKQAALLAESEARAAAAGDPPSPELAVAREQAGLWQAGGGLTLYRDYTRREVRDILAPKAPFTPYTGTWGYHGIVKVPERDGDFAFFVTFGQEQADHKFREWVTEDGVLHWESQPGQGLEDTWVQQFICHDERRNHTYLGQLKYLSHDPSRERPVCFRWRILDWHITRETLERMGLKLRPAELAHN